MHFLDWACCLFIHACVCLFRKWTVTQIEEVVVLAVSLLFILPLEICVKWFCGNMEGNCSSLMQWLHWAMLNQVHVTYSEPVIFHPALSITPSLCYLLISVYCCYIKRVPGRYLPPAQTESVVFLAKGSGIYYSEVLW